MDIPQFQATWRGITRGRAPRQQPDEPEDCGTLLPYG
jgi:hypothetical protein